jgi:hypothetical protein
MTIIQTWLWRAVIGLAVALALSTGVAVALYHREQAAVAEAKRVDKAEMERLAGLLVAVQGMKADVQASYDLIARENASLRAQVASVQHVAPKAKVVTVRQIVTKVVEVPAPAQPVPGAKLCALAVGEKAYAKVPQVDLKDETGNLLITGQVDLHAGDPDRLVLSLPFDATASRVTTLKPSAEVVRVRSRWALNVSGLWAKMQPRPTGGEVGAEMRVLGPAWLTLGAVHDGSYNAGKAGLRWEW